jgi:ABC-type nitrate/sulfonate/bicarbonate transport system permease component
MSHEGVWSPSTATTSVARSATNELERRALVELALSPPRARGLADSTRWVSLGSILLVATVWECVGRSLDPLFLSYPSAITRAFLEMLLTGELVRPVMASLVVFAIGLGLALGAGIGLGLLMGRFPLARYLLDPYLYALDATPRVALIPLFLLWLGLGGTSKGAIVFLSALCPVAISTLSGVRTVSASLVEVGRVFGAGDAVVFRKVVIPAALPFILAGARLGTGRALIGIITAEMLTAVTGTGGLLVRYAGALATDKVFVLVGLLGLAGALLGGAATALDARWTPWTAAGGRGSLAPRGGNSPGGRP